MSSSVGEGRVVVYGDSDLSSDSSGGRVVITSAEQYRLTVTLDMGKP